MMVPVVDGEHSTLNIPRWLRVQEMRIPLSRCSGTLSLWPKQRSHNSVRSLSRELELIANVNHGTTGSSAMVMIEQRPCRHCAHCKENRQSRLHRLRSFN
jgi:hypothetical protein